jgi:thymidylate synthase (FAD)
LSFVLREARLQDTKNRQNSIEVDDPALEAWWDAQQKFVIDNVKRIYSEAVERGVAKEQARAILPEGNTVSRLYMNGTLRSWIHFVELRSANGTQKEHQEVAHACAQAIAAIFPMATDMVAVDG